MIAFVAKFTLFVLDLLFLNITAIFSFIGTIPLNRVGLLDTVLTYCYNIFRRYRILLNLKRHIISLFVYNIFVLMIIFMLLLFLFLVLYRELLIDLCIPSIFNSGLYS